ncbi:MAG: hypothetical protein KIT09_14890 [Bryobacteraceae bacterium]|nr:hypothetical protein [Bryobacteraceae bacterium]
MSAGAVAPPPYPVRALSAGRKLLLPSPSDCLFIAWILWVFVVGQPGWSVLLDDGDAGWHIRVGESILETGAIPRTDPFSFTRPDAPWYAWEWLSDIAYAAAHRAAGLKGVTLLAGVAIAAFGALLFRYMIWRGANLPASLAAVMLAFGASSVHFLARPHVFTFVLVTAALWLLERDERAPDRVLWALAPAAAIWTNLHGGFVALLACLGILAAGSGVEALLGAPGGRQRAKRYALLLAACAAATLANPYGVRLHVHVYDYLRADWIRNTVEEFKSPLFRTENAYQFEALLFLGIMAAASLSAKRRLAWAGLILAWAHLALVSARHVPIFVIVAAPAIAGELTALWRRWVESAPRKSARGVLQQLSEDFGAGARRTSIWPVVFVVFLALVGEPLGWPADFPAREFPVAMMNRHRDLLASTRVFANDEWADYLLYRNYPRQRVFFDGRSDFYGPELTREYISAYQGRHDWRQILDRYRAETVLVPPDTPLASLLKGDAGWKLLEDNGEAALFVRRPASGGSNQSTAALMK